MCRTVYKVIKIVLTVLVMEHVHAPRHFDTNYEYVGIVTIVIGYGLENQGTVYNGKELRVEYIQSNTTILTSIII